MQETQKTSTKHIAALAFPFGTHAPPLLSLVQRISLSAPDVKFSFFSTAKSNDSLFNGNDEDKSIRPYNVHDGLPEDYVFGGNPEEPVGYFLMAAPGTFKRAMDQAEAETGLKISCLITDAFFSFAADMAEDMGVPWVALWTSGPRALLLHVDTEAIRQHMGLHGSKEGDKQSTKPSGFRGSLLKLRQYISRPAESTLDFLPGFSTIRAVDLPDGIINGNIDAPVSQLLCKMGQTLPRATAVATNSFEDLDSIVVESLKLKLRNFLNVGPFLLTSPLPRKVKERNCLEWLDKQKPASVAYVSFGSVIQPPPPEIAALAGALETSKIPFLWSLKGNAEQILPPGFLERIGDNGKIVPWTPQLEVLLHSSVGVFVTHCGWNSILESINGGVPLICRPFFGDQPLNRRLIEAVWEIGLGVDGDQFTKDGTIKALKRILSTDEGKKMREKILEKKELSLNAVQYDGSSTTNFKTLLEIVTK